MAVTMIIIIIEFKYSGEHITSVKTLGANIFINKA